MHRPPEATKRENFEKSRTTCLPCAPSFCKRLCKIAENHRPRGASSASPRTGDFRGIELDDLDEETGIWERICNDPAISLRPTAALCHFRTALCFQRLGVWHSRLIRLPLAVHHRGNAYQTSPRLIGN